MFGYIATDSTKLNKAQKKQYRRLYCGLCHALGERYGFFSRALLSFDTAFLLMLLERHGGCTVKSKRCPYKFAKKCEGICSENADYCADVTVLLAYLKLLDDVQDDNSLKARLLLRIFKKQYKKAKHLRPRLEKKLRELLDELSLVEKQNETNPDIPANIFAKLLAELFNKDEELYQTGYLLGRFIYLADACCDFKKDLKKGRYNPLIRYRQSDFYNMLARELGAVCDEISGLQINAYRDIIENVLFHGVWIKINLKGIYDTGSV